MLSDAFCLKYTDWCCLLGLQKSNVGLQLNDWSVTCLITMARNLFVCRATVKKMQGDLHEHQVELQQAEQNLQRKHAQLPEIAARTLRLQVRAHAFDVGAHYIPS